MVALRKAFRFSTIITAIFVSLNVLSPMPTAQAASTRDLLLYGAASMAMANTYYSNLDDKAQVELFNAARQKNGVIDDPVLTSRVDGVMTKLLSTGQIHRQYKWFVSPDKGFNASCGLGGVVTVFKGALVQLDDDELAAVLGHELRHGEGRHNIDGVKKQIMLGTLVNLYLSQNENNTSRYLGAFAYNWINNEVFTMNNEIEADSLGYDYYVAAGYNPGAMSAAFVKMRAVSGDYWADGLVQIVNPNNHPKTTNRIASAGIKMAAYSGGHVSVKAERIVQVNGQDIVMPVKSGNYLPAERAYLVAGNIARVYHDKKVVPATVGDDGVIYIGDLSVMTPADGDIDAQTIVDRLNKAMGFNS